MSSNVNTAKKILHGQKDKQKHMENCSGIPGVIYNFDNQNPFDPKNFHHHYFM